jgi:hypothetical protein
MKTTIEIPDALFRQAKAQAALKGIRLKDLVIRGLELALESENVGGESFRQNFPLIPGSSGRAVTSEDVRQTLELAEQEEAESVGKSVRR